MSVAAKGLPERLFQSSIPMILKVPIQILKFLVSALILLTGPVLQGQNLVTNGNFENGFSGWINLSGGTSVATYSLETASPYQGTNSMKALVTTAGTNSWDAQSLGPSFATTVGTNYTMTFYAKAALANTSIRMVVQNASYLSRSFSLTTQWAKYTWAFTAAESTPQLRIHYFQAGTFWIDNISVLPTASIPLTLTITPETRHQEMVGFGGALTWYRERVLTSPHSAAIKQLLFEDLGLDVVRFKNWYYPTGYPTNKSASDPDSKALYDTAKAANPDVKALLSSWSPPASLKSNGTLNNGGTLASDANGYRYTELGQYFVDALDNLGWTPDYLSFQNEPGYVATWDSCIFRPTQTPVNAGYAEASDAIYNAIKDRPNAPVMIGAEAESIGTASWSDWKNGAQVNRFREMNTPLLSRPYIGAHAYHTYNMYNESQIDGAIPQLNMIRDEFSDRPNFMTEFSNDNFDWLAAARAVHNTVVEGNASAYFYWTLVWDPGASCMIGIAADGTYTVGPHYYMLKHYSKYVSIGHRRIEVSGSTSDVKISGFINPKGSEITLVVINNSTSAKNVDLVQNSWPRQSIAADSSVAYQSVVDHYFQNIGTVDISTTQTLPAKSMTTYVVSLSQNRSWTGASGTAWDVNSSANWLEGDQKFFQFDKVTFGDTGAGNVAVTGVLTPDSITVNSASNYNFTAAAGNSSPVPAA